MFHKRNTYRLDMESADAALQQIFAACKQTPNTVPFDKLLLKQSAQTQFYDRILIFINICLAFTLCLPLIFYFLKDKEMVPSSITFSSHYIEEDKLFLDLDTDNATIRYEEAYLVDVSGDIYEIISYDPKVHILCFPYVPQECNIYIPYDENATLHLVLTPNTLKANN